MSHFKVTTYGGAQMPTGSQFMLEVGGKKFLIDCGLIQGEKLMIPTNSEPFAYDPSTIDALFVTHSHLDHVGRIPVLVKEGFSSAIFSTPPTREIAELIMLDSLGVLDKEAKFTGEHNLYGSEDVFKTMQLWTKIIPYEEVYTFQAPLGDVQIVFHDAGHILGSASIEFRYLGKSVLFSGDLGNTPSRLMKDTTLPKNIDYIFVESVYGDRNHEDKSVREKIMMDTIRATVKRGGTVIIPAFSIERTQEMLQLLNEEVEKGAMEKVPVYLDSPLGINVTKVYKKYSSYLSDIAVAEIKLDRDGDIFNFSTLKITASREESKHINTDTRPKIIIAGSGMSNGGRVLHHELHYISDPKSTILIVGYQAVHTLGRRLVDGDKNVEIMGKMTKVQCKIVNIHGFSAHKDSDNLVAYVASSAQTLKKVFVILGELKSSMYLAQRLTTQYGLTCHIPEKGEVIDLN